LKVSKLSEQVKTGLTQPTGIAYDYFEVEKTGFSDEDVEKASVNFKVKKSWLTENGFNQNNVMLMRFTGSKWEAMDTTFAEADMEYNHYIASVPGFSYFAVVGVTLEQKNQIVIEKETEEREQTAEDVLGTIANPPKPSNWWGWLTALVVVLVLGVGGWLLFGHHKQTGKGTFETHSWNAVKRK